MMVEFEKVHPSGLRADGSNDLAHVRVRSEQPGGSDEADEMEEHLRSLGYIE